MAKAKRKRARDTTVEEIQKLISEGINVVDIDDNNSHILYDLNGKAWTELPKIHSMMAPYQTDGSPAAPSAVGGEEDGDELEETEEEVEITANKWAWKRRHPSDEEPRVIYIVEIRYDSVHPTWQTLLVLFIWGRGLFDNINDVYLTGEFGITRADQLVSVEAGLPDSNGVQLIQNAYDKFVILHSRQALFAKDNTKDRIRNCQIIDQNQQRSTKTAIGAASNPPKTLLQSFAHSESPSEIIDPSDQPPPNRLNVSKGPTAERPVRRGKTEDPHWQAEKVKLRQIIDSQ